MCMLLLINDICVLVCLFHLLVRGGNISPTPYYYKGQTNEETILIYPIHIRMAL